MAAAASLAVQSAATIVSAARRSMSILPAAHERGDVTCGPIPPQGRQCLDIHRARV
jgi:hypothetical protein